MPTRFPFPRCCCCRCCQGDVYACMADVGWITGHSYIVYGPLANGATTLLFESTPTYPSPSRYWDVVQTHRVTQFYTAPTAIRALSERWGGEGEVAGCERCGGGHR